MEYIDVIWRHQLVSEPVRLVSELDAGRFEIRKLEFFPDGSVGFAGPGHAAGGTNLGLVPVPDLDQINADPDFEGVAMTAETFEMLWVRHACPARH